MKKILKVVGIIALVAIIGFSFACSGGGGDDNSDTPVQVTGVTLNKTSLSLAVGGSETLTVNVVPTNATNKTVTWSSSDTAKATVSNNGLVTAIAEGTATITVKTADGNKTATCAVTVTGGSDDGGIPVNIEMLPIPAGTFTMGSPTTEANRSDSEGPQHSVTLSSFKMSKYQVTQAQWVDVMGASEDRTTASYGKGNNYPVYYVNWYDAIVFCNKLSIKEGLDAVYSIFGKTNPSEWGTIPISSNLTWNGAVMDKSKNGYRLPTEAEWEYACRAGTTTAYNTGDTISDSTGWYSSNSGSKTHEVGKKPANAWGLYDMHGNVYEWCWGWYDSSYYSSSPTNDPIGASSGTNRVVRGGSWYHSAENMRSAYRGSNLPSLRSSVIGFRLIRT